MTPSRAPTPLSAVTHVVVTATYRHLTLPAAFPTVYYSLLPLTALTYRYTPQGLSVAGAFILGFPLSAVIQVTPCDVT